MSELPVPNTHALASIKFKNTTLTFHDMYCQIPVVNHRSTPADDRE